MAIAPLTRTLRRLRRAVLARRRLLAALLAGLAVLSAVRAAAEPAEPTGPVVVAARDLPGGTTVRGSDLRVVRLPVGAVPAGSTADVAPLTGRVLAAPLRAGEPVTDVRVVAPGLLEGFPGLVAAPVRVADPATVALLAAGDRVDVVAASPDGGGADVVVPDARVAAVPRPSPRTDGLVPGGLVVLAVTEPEALALAGAAVSSVLSVVLIR
ncbi:MAG TPA: Flp pilus assembly protein CpaB [Marmoricola sp.]|nr:Flp pilus assembly protein CpaB [Marmoricola sp.]